MYEIPQQLEYKEKIIFGLTFSQLIYALIFFPISFSLLFKLNANIVIRVFLATIPAVIASGFMFFGLYDKIKDWLIWFKYGNIKTKEKIQKLFEIEKIENNFIYAKNKKIAILGIEPINFSMKPKNEQNAITLTFQKFLNSLDFPIQILMITEELKLDDYLESLKSRLNTKNNGNAIFSEYKSYMEDVIKKNGVLNRNFYIVVKEVFDIEIQLSIIEERLNCLNLKTKRLKDAELKNLLCSVFGGNSILPKQILNPVDHLKIDGKYCRTIYADGYPRIVETGFLDKLISSSGNFDLSIHITPYPVETTLVTINRELQKQRADLYSAKIKNQLNTSLEIKYKDTRKILENIQKGQEKLFNINFCIKCKADTKQELDLLTRKVESELNSIMIIPRRPNFRMIQGFKTCLPLTENAIKINRNITTPGLSAFFPFTSSFFRFDDTGVWFGVNKNNIPIIRDIFKLSNANGICLATSGAGKSYLAKLFIARYLLNGAKVMIIDPQREYHKLVERFKGQRIDLSRTSDTIINPLDLMGHSYPEKRLALMDLMPIMLGKLTEPQKSFIDLALTKAYEKRGIYMDDPSTWQNKPPKLEDVLDVLKKMEKRASNLEKITIRSLANRMRLYVDGVFSFLNRHTKINFNNDLVCFDIGNMPKQVKPAIMFLVLDYVYMKMKKDLQRKILVIDEAWSLLGRSEEASYIFEIVKTCRKFNLGLFLINQEVEGMLESQAGRSVLANTSYTILLRQKPAVIDNIQKTFNLSLTEKNFLLTASVGEGILIMEDDHSKLKVIASEEEHKQITTNADELLKDSENQTENENQKIVNIKVDETIRLHKSANLTRKEKEYLLKKRFKEYSFKSLDSNKKENYILKTRFNESPAHLFVIEDIKNYLENKGIKVYTYATKKPDLVFELNNKKYAIEVETGSGLTKISDLKEKVTLLNKDYKVWFFVVTDRNKSKKYKKFGESVDLRYLKKRLSKIRR